MTLPDIWFIMLISIAVGASSEGGEILNKLPKRTWLTFIIIGLVGQLAWTIENMYFNVFLYNTISTDPAYIAAMVAASGIVATLTALLMGVLSDKLGKRKMFVCTGYILWGLATMAFGLITVDNVAALFPAANAVFAAAVIVVVMDCVMTFFGSTANDAAFNAYITDVTDTDNRGRVESVLAILPLVSMLVIFGAFDGMTRDGRWREFFTIFGGAVILTGVLSIFLMKEAPVQKRDEGYLKNVAYGFKPSVIRENPMLYTALAAFGVFNVAVQVFFPYLIIYIQNYLKIEGYAIVLGVVLIIASLVSVLSGRIIDKVGKLRFTVPAMLVMLLGLAAMFFVRGFLGVIIAGTVMMSGYMLVTAALSGTIRDYTPGDKAGLFQGIRMIFQVLLPMIIGPYIGAAVIRNSEETYVELGVTKLVPTPAIFLAAAAVLVFLIIPVTILKRRERKC